MHLLDQQLNLMVRGQFKEAWKVCEKLEKTQPNDPRHIFNRAWFFIKNGDFQQGYQMLDAGRHIGVYGGAFIDKKPIWNNHDMTGKTVLLNGEGGLGDQMISARFANDIVQRNGKCIISCENSLKPLLSTIPGVSETIGFDKIHSTEFDYWIPGFSAIWLFGYTKDTISNQPYIAANPQSVDVWKGILNSEKYKVGIRWSGSPRFEHQQFRYFDPSFLINICKPKDNIQYYSLQRDNDTRELPDHITDLQHMLISWVDTAACIANLDLVITSCTSIAHLASAMGKKTWVIVPILPYHIWTYGDKHSPWYQETTTVFRQKKFGEWDQTFKNIEKELKKL